MNTPSVARLNASHAVACWEDSSDNERLKCAPLTHEGTALSMGATAVVVEQQVKYVSVVGLGEQLAVVCYIADGDGDRGKCAALTVS